ncbi:MAG: DNA-directed RNA polymerase subunit omega [Ignavibacteriae bacterium]|nr:DNA-directed RNA polymerase subunit omega [Ignavibacteriota bacterium]
MEIYTVNPVKVRMKESEKGVIYKSIVAMGFRARQVNDFIKSELNVRMADVIDTGETDAVNFDQIAISREFDRIPKPTFIAMKEMYENKLTYQLPEIPETENIIK